MNLLVNENVMEFMSAAMQSSGGFVGQLMIRVIAASSPILESILFEFPLDASPLRSNIKKLQKSQARRVMVVICQALLAPFSAKKASLKGRGFSKKELVSRASALFQWTDSDRKFFARLVKDSAQPTGALSYDLGDRITEVAGLDAGSALWHALLGEICSRATLVVVQQMMSSAGGRIGEG
ncbi:MAG TPA: hypothetical protein GXX23_09280 [Firmicutes bacterium]|nr:hypothetical protein [Candidatus Fermentithermobacillaceae bacterium]